ncbi:MAG: YdcF family protein [Candidatus Pacebacteria bacterium]|nr:YdcF family protein [Candidatus Paceibacterota bacterium]
MKNIRIKIIITFCSAIAISVVVIIAINYYINSKSAKYIYQEMANVPQIKVALVLGAKVNQNGTLSPIYQDRVQTAFELYESKKVEKIIVSGDHGRENYDEVNSAKDYLLERGMESEDIFLDYAGFDTYDSLYRAKEIFQVSSLVVVTQNFHLSRAVYIGKSLGLETYGMSADKHQYIDNGYSELREKFSKIKAFFDVNLNSKPKFLGENISIEGDGRESWDEKYIPEVFEKNEIDNEVSDDISETNEDENADGFVEEKEITIEDVEIEKNLKAEFLVEEESIQETKTKNILLEVPFAAQAPFGNWSDARKQDGCEEVAAIMAMAWVRGEGLMLQEVDDRINEISAFEEKEIGTFHDASADDVVEIIFKKYFEYNQVEVKYDIDKEDIKAELYSGNLIIVPTDGQLLNNPNYTPPGPTTHNLVAIGYDFDSKEFITNDSGTRNGKQYRYDEDVLERALLDYPTGFHENLEEIRTAMIVVRK